MEKETAVFLKNKGINTLITDKYLTKGCYDTFDNIISLSSTKSVISAAIGFGLFGEKCITYIDNFFEFLYVYDDCYKDIPLNLIVSIDHNKLPNNISFDIFDKYNLKYCILGKRKNDISFEELITSVFKNKESGVIILRS